MPTDTATPARLDIAPFARLTTSDPARKDGARTLRTEPYLAPDVFLETSIASGADGRITVPTHADGVGCVGLSWPETRRLHRLRLRFADAAPRPAGAEVVVEHWQGESAWQGEWVRFATPAVDDGDCLAWRIDPGTDPAIGAGTQKVRWIFPAAAMPAELAGLEATSESLTHVADLRLVLDPPLPGRTGRVQPWNGFLSGPGGAMSGPVDWDLGAPLELAVVCSCPEPWKTDRTVLRFRLPDAAFAVAVADVLDHGAVFVAHAGLFVTGADADGTTPTAYAAAHRGRATVLDQVRSLPEQTFAAAWDRIHNPVQDHGPMLLSLACDNRKFVAHRDGTVTFLPYGSSDERVPTPDVFTCRISPWFGDTGPVDTTRCLDGGWLPIPTTSTTVGGRAWRQRTWTCPVDAAPDPPGQPWLYDRAMCVMEFETDTVRAPDAPDSADAGISFALVFDADTAAERGAVLEPVDGGAIAVDGDRLLAFVRWSPVAGISVAIDGNALRWSGAAPAGRVRLCAVHIPAWRLDRDRYRDLDMPADGGRERVETYWRGLLTAGARIEVPDEMLDSTIRASRVHCLLAARNKDRGERVEAWISADRYGALESEAHSVIRGLDMMGHEAFARRSLDWFIGCCAPEGFLTTGYTLMGTGWHLWTLAEHHDRWRNSEWLDRVAPNVARAARWVMDQCAMTRRLDPAGDPVPEHGLVPPGVAADWNRYAYRFVQEAHYAAGLAGAADVLAAARHPDAGIVDAGADALRSEIVRAYRWTQARSPVLPLSDGRWVPAYPALLYCLGRIGDIIPGEDGDRSWCYDIELGAHHLAALGILDAGSDEVTRMIEQMEDDAFLRDGLGDYPADRNRADPFHLGGFSKVQPYYTRIAEIYALRDEVKPFLRSYFNAIPTLLSRETLSFWEHFKNVGGWNKTHETGYFLVQTRLMLAMERGDDLWLAPFVPSAWLEDGAEILVDGLPTRFGRVGFQVRSALARDRIEVEIAPPTRTPPARIVLRLRHPGGVPIRDVRIETASGAPRPHTDFDSSLVRLSAATAPCRIRVSY